MYPSSILDCNSTSEFINARMKEFEEAEKENENETEMENDGEKEMLMKEMLEWRENDSNNALHCVVNAQSLSFLKYLLNNVYNTRNARELIDIANSDGWTALHFAGQKSTEIGFEIFKLLIKHEFCLGLHTKTRNGWYIIDIAAKNNSYQVLKYLLTGMKDNDCFRCNYV